MMDDDGGLVKGEVEGEGERNVPVGEWIDWRFLLVTDNCLNIDWIEYQSIHR